MAERRCALGRRRGGNVAGRGRKGGPAGRFRFYFPRSLGDHATPGRPGAGTLGSFTTFETTREGGQDPPREFGDSRGQSGARWKLIILPTPPQASSHHSTSGPPLRPLPGPGQPRAPARRAGRRRKRASLPTAGSAITPNSDRSLAPMRTQGTQYTASKSKSTKKKGQYEEAQFYS